MGNRVIYRPAYDAEVEYLESDGNSFIDTGLKASSELGILAHIQNSKDNRSFPFGGADGVLNKEYGFQMSNGTYSSFRFGNGGTGNILPKLDSTTIYEFNNIDSHNIINVNDIVYQTTFNSFTSDYNFHLFRENRGDVSQGSNNGVRIYDFKIYNNSTLVRDYIPVRIGSVGYLYDKVSKQLFANKGTGNFILGNDVSNAVIPQQRCVLYFGNQRSVGFERIYEEYEWLVATIPVGVLMMSLPLDSYNFYYQRIWQVFGNVAYFQTEGHTYFTMQGNRQVAIYDISTGQSYTYTSFPKIDAGELMTVDSNSTRTLIHNVEVERYAGEATTYIKFQNAGNGVNTAEYSNSSITVDGSVRYIPCKLLQSIPAILDGNGIARQAGECGMWDKVSNKFYGNVASSGTFTVKGPKCYEEYEWLVANGDDLQSSGPQNVALFSFPSDMNLVGKTVQLTMGAPCRDIYVYRYVGAGLYLVLYVWNGNVGINSNNQPILYSPLVSQEPMVLDFGNNLVSYNGQQIQIAGNSFYIYFPSAAIEGKRKYGRIYCQGLFDFTPCKLTHGIPASMDANGIARPAGTCGMWDKVNDKFYGNAASSGTFTVSND